jgi:hypothetical protein
MNVRYPLRYALLLGALLALPAAAQGPDPGTCMVGGAQASLDVSDVQATLFTTGALFYGNQTAAGYLVPKLTGRSPVYAAGIWVGGMIGGDLRVAGATYADYEFWPGPLDPATGRPVDPADCSAYDRIWTVSVRDVEAYEATGVASPDLAGWPAGLGAEVVDGDGTAGNYDLAGGDRPRIYGSQTAFWVMNDVGNAHQSMGTAPIGLEVRVHAFAVASLDDVLNRATIYRYTLVNRNAQPLTAAHASIFADPDLGDSSDDYVGADTVRGLGYVYNADDADGNGNAPSYGTPPPAAGFDLLGGAGSFRDFSSSGPTSDPQNGPEMYNAMQGLWTDGVPITEGGTGYNTGGPVTTFVYSGDPVSGSFWSERCLWQSTCGANSPGDRRFVLTSPAFDLAAGAAYTFDVALLFGQGGTHLTSVTALRAASDAVQAAYDAGTLFEKVDPPASLAAPALLGPADGAVYSNVAAPLSWSGVAGAEGYVVEVWDAGSPATRRTSLTTETALGVEGCGSPNRTVTCAWRVRADAPSAGAVGQYAETRTFLNYTFVAGLQDGSGSVIETASPAGPPCPDPGDFGCEAYGGEGNTVYREPGSTADYYVTAYPPSTDANAGLLAGGQFALTAAPDDYEIRFTAAGGYAVYNAFLGGALPRQIARVPFEVWNVGTTPNDPSDDLRMIPVLRQNVTGNPFVADWTHSFTATDVFSGDTLGVTEQVAAFFPDRADGYARFEAAAIAFGGAGAIYDPANDGDTQIDLTPGTATPCSRQAYYIAFCARNDRRNPPGSPTQLSAGFVQLAFADLAMDGTTPPTGTVVRLKMARYAPPVASEPGAPGEPAALVIEGVRPNPVAGVAAVRYVLPEAGRVRVAVYDVLGRVVAVLAEGPAVAGRYEASVAGGSLAPGVYVVAVETAGGRAARTFTVLR